MSGTPYLSNPKADISHMIFDSHQYISSNLDLLFKCGAELFVVFVVCHDKKACKHIN